MLKSDIQSNLELLEEAEEEMAENIALPIAIVLVVGFLGLFFTLNVERKYNLII